MTIRKRNENEIEVSGYLVEDWVNEIIKKSFEGYRIVEGSMVAFSTSKTVVMTNAEETIEEPVEETIEEPIEEPVEVIVEEPEQEEVVVEEATNEAETATLDMELIESFEGDKNLLEEYGKDFGIDLKKNKKFENMLGDLIQHVGG